MHTYSNRVHDSSHRLNEKRRNRRLKGSALTVLVACFVLVAGALHADQRGSGTDIVSIARQYLGTPYQYGGNTPSGFDCSGFVGFVYNKAGYNLPRNAGVQYSRLNPVRVPRPGDLVFFNTSGSSVSHVGIYVGNYRFIHAPSSGKTVSYADIRTQYWKSRYVGTRTVFRQTGAVSYR
ncbi:MAG: C40 family peptidase [Leptospiraceae bacterium]|nr:C40 family peptidase [Leptospiraceae bacterium]MCB1318655.1 C40 family peptidase [Leptospiraceae bacterium]